MFRNMIIKKSRSGENYPIETIKDLREKIQEFNTIQEIENISLELIIQTTVKDYVRKKLRPSHFRIFIRFFERAYARDPRFLEDFYKILCTSFFNNHDEKNAEKYFEKNLSLTF